MAVAHAVRVFRRKGMPCEVQVIQTEGLAHWRIRLDLKNGTSQWPVQYANGQIAYDNPYGVPAYAMRMVESAFAFRARAGKSPLEVRDDSHG